MDLFWYDGSMKPPTPGELEGGAELEPEGMMFVGDTGKILAGFRGENARLIPESRMREYIAAGKAPQTESGRRGGRNRAAALAPWVAAVRGGKPTYGDFLLAGPISDAFNLGAVSLRMGGRRLLFDSANVKVTNAPEANQYLGREYRRGWELNHS